MIQDKDGFMWFGTEGGLSRFDGTHFKTFTTADGLPDNEILKMFQDSKGRIWLLPFKNSLCYYFNGKFYNPQNDSVLKKIRVRERLLNIFEDSAGTIWTHELDAVYKLFSDNRIERSESLDGIKLNGTLMVSNDPSGIIWFSVWKNSTHAIYKMEKGRTTVHAMASFKTHKNDFFFTSGIRIWRTGTRTHMVETDKYRTSKPFSVDGYIVNTYSVISDSIVSCNTEYGALLLNVRTGKTGPVLLENKSISRVLKGSEGNLWVSTLREGVFSISSENFKTIELFPEKAMENSLTPVARIDSFLFVITVDSRIAKIGLPSLQLISIKRLSQGYYFSVTDLFKVGDRYFLPSVKTLWQTDRNFNVIPSPGSPIVCKDVVRDEDTLIIATHLNVFRLDMTAYRPIDTIWQGRATAVYLRKDTIYVGTLNGLYALSGKKYIPYYLGNTVPLLRSRISSISESEDGSLWIGTIDNGLIRLKDNSVMHHYTTANGLSSNICRTVFIDGRTVWVGTNKGLNKIEIGEQAGKVITIGRTDGLGSDLVNKILVYGDTVFVGTSEGTTYFNKNLIRQYSECRLNILDISGNPEILPTEHVYRANDKTIKINYAGISYKSAGDIVYKYRLKGVDDIWKTTRETTLEFVALPYGRYDLELVAENKFGVISNTVVIKLEVPIPFWKTAWFYVLVAIGFIGFTLWLYRYRLKTVRSREAEKTNLNKKLVEMEMKALRAQMNPHFTFNVLSSIQYYIGYNDRASAQNYLAKFAKLIRLTLDNSKNTFIALSEEMLILKLYLELEKMRFGDKFDYDIVVDESINPEVLMPNMLIQPFVENAIKHAFKEEVKNPKVEIKIAGNTDSIHCTITDNGSGRNSTKQFADNNSHKPAGVAMVLDKAEALRYYYNYNVSIEIIDLHTSNNDPCGTMVFIKIPKQISVP